MAKKDTDMIMIIIVVGVAAFFLLKDVTAKPDGVNASFVSQVS